MRNSSLHTVDPVALRCLMTETIFGVGEPTDAVVAAPPQFSHYGGNKRNFLFLTHDARHEWMSDAAFDAFTKTLGALKLSMDDVAVLNVGKLPSVPAEADLVAFFHPKAIVALGASVPWGTSSTTTVFQTYSFDEMLVDAEKKRTFWATVKTLLI